MAEDWNEARLLVNSMLAILQKGQESTVQKFEEYELRNDTRLREIEANVNAIKAKFALIGAIAGAIVGVLVSHFLK